MNRFLVILALVSLVLGLSGGTALAADCTCYCPLDDPDVDNCGDTEESCGSTNKKNCKRRSCAKVVSSEAKQTTETSSEHGAPSEPPKYETTFCAFDRLSACSCSHVTEEMIFPDGHPTCSGHEITIECEESSSAQCGEKVCSYTYYSCKSGSTSGQTQFSCKKE